MAFIYVQGNKDNKWMLAQSWQSFMIKNSYAPQRIVIGSNKYLILSGDDEEFVLEDLSPLVIKERENDDSFESLNKYLKSVIDYVEKLPTDLLEKSDPISFLEEVEEDFYLYQNVILDKIDHIFINYVEKGYRKTLDHFIELLGTMDEKRYLIKSTAYKIFTRYYILLSNYIYNIEKGNSGIICNLETGAVRRYLVTNVCLSDMEKYYSHTGISRLSETERTRLLELFY